MKARHDDNFFVYPLQKQERKTCFEITTVKCRDTTDIIEILSFQLLFASENLFNFN